MLVLSRRLHESIVLPNCQATITVLGIQGGRIRLGVSAPPCVEVHRFEVWERMQEDSAIVTARMLNPSTPSLPK